MLIETGIKLLTRLNLKLLKLSYTLKKSCKLFCELKTEGFLDVLIIFS